jgi:MoaA/NifB/PqqE/SkfB family radical SAM enzyme
MAAQLFCSRPFTWFEPYPDGKAHLCCFAWMRMHAGNWLEQSIEEIWNSPAAQEIRSSILDGSFRHCKHSECYFLQSGREPVMTVERAKQNPAFARIIENQTTVMPGPPTKIVCSFDATCNLACPSCRSEKIVERPDPGSPRFQLAERILALAHRRQLDLLYITGSGEPFFSRVFLWMLKNLQSHSAPDMWLYLHTNALLFTPTLWSHFPDAARLLKAVHVSLDAANSETYAKNRGGDWQKLMTNVEFIAGLDLRFLVFSMVVQANNFREIPDFMKLADSFGAQPVLQKLSGWAADSGEYSARAVHQPDHDEFKGILCDALDQHPTMVTNLRTVVDRAVY